jgi:phosphoesterase RecJ-like protein
MEDRLKNLVEAAQTILVIQADNPDGDSLSSSLALEQILGDMGKDPVLYCGAEIPTYLRYLDGWDRVVHELPNQFDLSIIVDTSSRMLLEILDKSGQIAWIKAKPSIVIDHHVTDATIDFATLMLTDETVSTTELIYEVAKKLNWPRNNVANDMLAVGILSDSMGLTSEAVSARTVHIIGELIEAGVSLARLENGRRSTQKKSPAILAYKGQLLGRIDYSEDQRVAHITIPWDEIEKYSHEYNPPMLVLDEMRQVEHVCLAIAFKTYPDGRITGKIRANYGYPVAAALAEAFGGGGHVYASGFRITDGRTLDQIKPEVIKQATALLDTLSTDDEALQYAQ